MRVRDVMQSRVTTVTEGDGLGLALQIMLWQRVRHLPVLRDGRVVGILSHRDLLERRAQQSETGEAAGGTVGEAMSSPVASIPPDASLDEAATRMTVGKIGCLPVIDGERLVGIVTTTDLLAEVALPAPETPIDETPVAAIMTRDVVSVHEDEPVLDAAAKMTRVGVRHLPVIDGEGRVVGILSDRDIRQVIGNPLAGLSAQPQTVGYETTKVADVMTPDPHTLKPEDTLAGVTNVFIRERIGALPIVDEGELLLGIVSYVDLLRALAEAAAGNRTSPGS